MPFDHQDIKIYIDNLFVEGKLDPVDAPGFIETDPPAWIQCGIAPANTDDERLRISRLFSIAEKELPARESRYKDWTAFALKWAELSCLVHCNDTGEFLPRLNAFGEKLNAVFAEWLVTHYAGLMSLPPVKPVMLHHIPRHLARNMEKKTGACVALIVADGLAFDQWVTIRQILQKQDRDLMMRESAIFAWIPTLTSVSRQSIFSGKPPLYFPSSIHSTYREEKLWSQFWQGIDMLRMNIIYKRGLGDGDGDVEAVMESVINPGHTCHRSC